VSSPSASPRTKHTQRLFDLVLVLPLRGGPGGEILTTDGQRNRLIEELESRLSKQVRTKKVFTIR